MSIEDLLVRCERTAIIGELLQTIPTYRDREKVVSGLFRGNVVSETTHDLLLEYYCKEAA